MPGRRRRLSVSYEVYERSHWERRSVCGGELAEFQIDKVAAMKEILQKKLEEEDILDGLGVERRDELRNINRRWGSSREENDKKKNIC